MDESVMNYPTKLLHTNPPLKGDIGDVKNLLFEKQNNSIQP